MAQAEDKPITEEFNEGWEEGRHSADVEVMQLRAEIERLRAENADLRRWKTMDKPMTAAMAVVSNDVQQLRAQLTEAAAFLDRMAGHIDAAQYDALVDIGRETAADCRAMAEKLRK